MIKLYENAAAFQPTQHVDNSSVSSLHDTAFVRHRVHVPHFHTPWVEQLRPKIDQLASLEYGWDGYAGEPVSFTCALFAVRMMDQICLSQVPAPSLVPGSDGTLQLEWHLGGYDIELDILDTNRVVATRFDLHTDEEVVVELANDFRIVYGWMRDLAKRLDHARDLQEAS